MPYTAEQARAAGASHWVSGVGWVGSPSASPPTSSQGSSANNGGQAAGARPAPSTPALTPAQVAEIQRAQGLPVQTFPARQVSTEIPKQTELQQTVSVMQRNWQAQNPEQHAQFVQQQAQGALNRNIVPGVSDVFIPASSAPQNPATRATRSEPGFNQQFIKSKTQYREEFRAPSAMEKLERNWAVKPTVLAGEIHQAAKGIAANAPLAIGLAGTAAAVALAPSAAIPILEATSPVTTPIFATLLGGSIAQKAKEGRTEGVLIDAAMLGGLMSGNILGARKMGTVQTGKTAATTFEPTVAKTLRVSDEVSGTASVSLGKKGDFTVISKSTDIGLKDSDWTTSQGIVRQDIFEKGKLIETRMFPTDIVSKTSKTGGITGNVKVRAEGSSVVREFDVKGSEKTVIKYETPSQKIEVSDFVLATGKKTGKPDPDFSPDGFVSYGERETRTPKVLQEPWADLVPKTPRIVKQGKPSSDVLDYLGETYAKKGEAGREFSVKAISDKVKPASSAGVETKGGFLGLDLKPEKGYQMYDKPVSSVSAIVGEKLMKETLLGLPERRVTVMQKQSSNMDFGLSFVGFSGSKLDLKAKPITQQASKTTESTKSDFSRLFMPQEQIPRQRQDPDFTLPSQEQGQQQRQITQLVPDLRVDTRQELAPPGGGGFDFSFPAPPIVPVPGLGFPDMGGGESRRKRRGRQFGTQKLAYTPSLVGILSGKTIKKAPKGSSGLGIRYPVAQKIGKRSAFVL